MMSRITAAVFVALALVLALSTTAQAQSAIAGVVKDASGAVLPGVTVEVSSDVLIEKSKSASTDGEGHYKIIDLRPGVYVVTFSLSGFTTTKREGVELPSNFTATINGDLKVGALEETVTVSGVSPVVDIQSTTQSQSLTAAVLDAVPTGRTLQSIAQLIPGIKLSAPDVGGAHAMQQTSMSAHGMASTQTVVQMDGLGWNSVVGDGGVQVYQNTAVNDEMVYQTSGANADVDAGGVRLNMIPKRGGNVLSGSFATYGVNKNWQSDNLSADLIKRGLKATDKMDKLLDVEVGVGGKIVKDKLWYFFAFRRFRVNSPIADTFYADGRQGIDDQWQQSGTPRLTYQITPRLQFSAYVDKISKNRGHAMTAGYDPEKASSVWHSPQYMAQQAKLTSTVTNKTYLEIGYSSTRSSRTVLYQPGINAVRGTPEWYGTAQHNDTTLATFTVAGVPNYRIEPTRQFLQSAVSYVTGSHNIKTGVQFDWSNSTEEYTMNGDLRQQYHTVSGVVGVGYQVNVYNTPVRYTANVPKNLGIYGQDSWTLKRLTVSVGLRWQEWATEVGQESSPAGRFVGAREFAGEALPPLKTIDPRTGVVYDLFGNGKTAIKFSANKYEQAGTVSRANSYNPIASLSNTLTWTDTNRDDIAQGELGCVYQSANCEIDFSLLATTFGTVKPGCSILATPGSIPCGSAQLDPNVKRTNTRNYNLGVQHELLPRVSVSANWFHVDYHNLTLRQNVLQTPNDYTPHDVVSPLDGSVITIYDVSNAKKASVQNLDRTDPDGRQTYNGFEFSFSSRLPGGATLFGGATTEKTLTVTCNQPSNPNNLLYCDQTKSGIPFRTSIKLAGSVTLPVVRVRLSGSLQSLAGDPQGVTAWQITNSTKYAADCKGPCTPGGFVDPGLIATGSSSLNVSLVPPGTEFFDRLNQLDLNFGKVISLPGKKVRFEPEFSIFNALNVGAVSAVRSSLFGTTAYLQPSAVLQGRFIRLGGSMKW